VWTGVVMGIVLEYHPCILTAASISGLHFDMYNVILENYIIYGLSLKCYGIVYPVLHIWVLLFTISTASLYLMC